LPTRNIIILGILAATLFFVCGVFVQTVILVLMFPNEQATLVMTPTATYIPIGSARPESPSLEATAIPILPLDIPPIDDPNNLADETTSEAENLIDLPDLEILSDHQYLDERGRHHIVGEIRNNSDQPMEFVQVIAQYYDEEGLRGANLTFTDPDFVAPGQVVPFDIVILRREHWAKEHLYQLSVKGYNTEKLSRENLVVVSQDSQVESGFLFVKGEVMNTGSEWVLGKAVVTLHDAHQTVINTKWDYIGKAVIAPGELAAFEVKLEHQTSHTDFNYRIQIEEDEVSAPIVVDQTPTPVIE